MSVLAVLAVVAGVVLRLWPRTALWLDEAQSLAIARAPLAELPATLRTDGAPPLYYALLHVWMQLFGTGDWAVRSLSVIASLATIPVIGVAARRYGGHAAVWPAVVLLATNPFAIRYATEARMYALIAFEAAIGLVLVPRALERPSPSRLGAVALLVAALLYTHYWSVYLIGGVGIVLLYVALTRRRSHDADSRALAPAVAKVLLAMATGVVLWLPWLPSFRFQAAHTGTPWAARPSLWNLLEVVPSLSAGRGRGGGMIAFVLTVLVLLALFGKALDGRRTELDWRTRPAARGLVGVLVLVPTLALLGGFVSGSAFVTRYLSAVFPVLVVLTAMGLVTLGSPRLRVGLLAVASVACLAVAASEVRNDRTPARHIAAQLLDRAAPGDVVVFCPDQVGPALARELEGTRLEDLDQGTYPFWLPPGRVDWVDYEARHLDSEPFTFASEALSRAGAGDVWLVWSPGYPPTQQSCTALRSALARLRPGEEVLAGDRPGVHLDHAGLLRYPAQPASVIR
ncbi:MAG: hypothetical protein GEV08_08135 [Acidimicrobiia bacterium]|nr:hypothetical protein [Acidimicrobiia bacterium]